jgi:manganese/iron transport system permease protein
LPGLVGAVVLGAPLVLGGLAGALVAAVAIALTRQIPKVEADTAIAVVVTTLFGAGALLALSRTSPPGLSGLLFGDVLGVSGQDLALATGLAIVTGAVLWILHWRLLAVGFDRDAAASSGVSPVGAELAVLILTSLVVVVGVEALGSLLVLAVLVAPAMAAGQLFRRPGGLMAASVLFAALGGLLGIYASYYLGTAAGASVALAMLAIYALVATPKQLARRS